MNEQARKAIDRARLAVKAGPDPSSEFYGVSSVYVQPGVLATLCDALEAAERRAEEAEARDAHNRAEVERVIGPTLAAMKRVGVESLPDATEELIRRLDAVEAERDELATLYRVAEARERRMERELLAVWATVRPGEPAPLTERDVLHAVEDVQSEAVSLRAIIADCAAAIGNGSGCSKDASVEFMAMIPAEIRADVAALRDRAGIAEGREAAAKANAEQMAGWLDARNAGLVQMARERDALRIEAEALRIERDVADRECDRLRAQVDADRQELTRLAERAARMVARVCAGCHGRGAAHLDGDSPRCAACGGAGAVIVEGAAPALTVADLQRESYETARAKGWHDEDGKMMSGTVIHIAKQAVGVLDVAATVEGLRVGKAPIYSHPEHIRERMDALPPELLRAVSWMVLVVTEVGESIEDILNEHMATDVNLAGKPTGLGSELADIVIRVCDSAGALGIDMEAELRAKLAFNRTRSHKHGGKLA